MKPEILHIYGPFGIQIYGLIIAFGIVLFTWFVRRDPRFKQLKLQEKFTGILLTGIFAGLIGGRVLYLLTEADAPTSFADIFAYWNGGLSILGTVGAVVLVLPWYLHRCNVPIVPFLDLVGIYAPLLQGVARTGCFFAGCCYGAATTLPWGVVYTQSEVMAPLGVCVHPTQLYSTALFLIIFALMYFVLQYRLKKAGQLFGAYLVLQSIERFLVDFWRGDRPMLTDSPFSSYQVVALGIACGGAIIFTWASTRRRHS